MGSFKAIWQMAFLLDGPRPRKGVTCWMGPWIHPKPDPGGSLNVLGLECGSEILQPDLGRQR